MCSILSDTEMMTHSWQPQGSRQMDNSNRVTPPQVPPPQVQQQNRVAFAWRAPRTQYYCRAGMSACVQHVQPFSKPKDLTMNPRASICAPYVGHGLLRDIGCSTPEKIDWKWLSISYYFYIYFHFSCIFLIN